MSDEKRYKEYDEVNLMPLFRFIKSKVDKLGNSFSFMVRSAAKRTTLLLLCLVIGVVASVGRYFLSKPVYHSSAIYASNMFGIEYSEQFIKQLNQLAREDNYEGLSQELNLPVEDARKIQMIDFEFFNSQTGDTTLGLPFRIHAFVYDYSLLDTLQYSILHYMENNDYAHRRKAAKIATLTDLSEMINKAITELDTLKKANDGVAIAKQRLDPRLNASSSESSASDMAYISPVEIYKQKVALYEEGLKIKEQIKLFHNYELIQGFTKFVKPYSPRLIRDTVYFCILALLAAVGFSVILELKDQKRVKSMQSVSEKEQKEQYI